MDIFSHLLWGNLEYRLIPQTKGSDPLIYGGIFFSIFPDLLTFAYPFIWLVWHRFIKRDLALWPKSNEEYEALPCAKFTHTLYSISHSLVVWLVVFLLTWALGDNFPWILLGWATHIIIDIFTHEKKIFATPFLWPLSNYGFDGYAWNSRGFLTFNFIILTISYIFFIYF